jgi:heptosyltransferase I
LLEGDPDLDGLFYFQRRGWNNPENWFHVADELRRMRALRFDWVLDLQSLARTGMIAWLANGGLTIGLDDKREGASGFYDMVIPRPSYDTHAVDWYLEVVRKLHVPDNVAFDWLPKRPSVVARIQAERKQFNRLVILSPGARWENKRWPVEYYGEVTKMLAEAPGLGVVVLGSGKETALGKAIAAAAPDRVIDLTGKTSLPEMVEWIRASELMITNDTGPMHIAAALKIPIVPLFGPTTPTRTGPYGQIQHALQQKLYCVPCMKPECSNPNTLECLKTISPERVMVAAQSRKVVGQQAA